MIDITIIARAGLEIVSEFPTNGFTLELRPRPHMFLAEPTSFTLRSSLEEWYKLRKVFPKAEGYELTGHYHDGHYQQLSDHPAADAWAEEFYNAELAKRKPPPEPETPPIDPAEVPDMAPQGDFSDLVTPTPIPPMTEAEREAMLHGDGINEPGPDTEDHLADQALA